MYKEFLDSPLEIEEWLEKLDDKERGLFDRGYLVALLGLMEQLIDTKTKMLSRLLDEEISDSYRLQLESRIHILEVFEKHYKTRARILEPTLSVVADSV